MKPGLIAPEEPRHSDDEVRTSPAEGPNEKRRLRGTRFQRRIELADVAGGLVEGSNAVSIAFLYALGSLVWFGGGWQGWFAAFPRDAWSSDPSALRAATAGLVALAITLGWCVATYRRNPWIPALLTLEASFALACLWVESESLSWLVGYGMILPGLGTTLWSHYHREAHQPPSESDGELLKGPMLRTRKAEVERATETARTDRSTIYIAIGGSVVIGLIAFVFRHAAR